MRLSQKWLGLYFCNCARNCAHCLDCAHWDGHRKAGRGVERKPEKGKGHPGEVAYGAGTNGHSLGATLLPASLHEGLGDLDIVGIHDVVAPFH